MDGEIWRWHIPSDTVDVVVKHENLWGMLAIGNDLLYCIVYDDSAELGRRPGHFHVISQNLTVPYEDVPQPLGYPDGIFLWFKENVYK